MTRMYKQTIALIALLIIAAGVNAQTLERSVIGTLGGYSAPAGGPQLLYNMGETNVATLPGGGYMLTQGFEQPVTNVPAISGLSTVCGSSQITLSDTLSGGVWSCANTSVATVGSTSGIVTGVGIGTATISYALYGDTVTTVVTVNTSTALITGVPYVATGSTVALSDGTTGGAWGTSSSGIATVDASGIVSGVAAGSVVISYIPGGCPATTATITVVPAGVLCIGRSVQLSDTVSGGTWNSVNPGCATVTATTGIVNGVIAGTTTIKHTATGGYLRTYTVTVNPLTAITGNSSLCGGKTLTIYNTTAGGGLWASDDNIVASVNNAGVVTAAYSGTNTSAGIYFITPAGCVSEKTITVNAALPVTGSMSACQGRTTTLGDGIAGGIWACSNAGYATVVAGTGVVTGVSTGKPVISYTLPSGCISLATVNVSAISPITGNATVCNGQTVAVYNTTTGGGAWSAGLAQTPVISVSNTGIVTGLSAGTGLVTFTTPAGCAATKAITVNPSDPITGITTVCTGQATALSDDLAGGTWSTSNPGFATITGSGIVSGVAASTPVIKYTLPTGCVSSATVTVRALSPITGSATACAGRTTQLYNTTTGGGVWSTSTSAIATVNASGLLSANTPGAANIIFTTPLGCITNKTITSSACREADSTTVVTSVATGIDDIILFPNPNMGSFTISGTLSTEYDGDVFIDVTDMLGQSVYKSTVTARSGVIMEQMQLSNTLANGMYLLNLRAGAENKVFHFVVGR